MFVWLALVLALWLNYETWQSEYRVSELIIIEPKNSGTVNLVSLADSMPATSPNILPIDNSAQLPTPANTKFIGLTNNIDAAITLESVPIQSKNLGRVKVTTDVLDLDISLQGGNLLRADLLNYPEVKGTSKPVRLLNQEVNAFYYIQSGLTDSSNTPHPNHLARFTSAQEQYSFELSGNELRVPLIWVDTQRGVTVTKTYIFKRGQYKIDLEYEIQNQGTLPWSASSYARILRDDKPVEQSMFDVESYAFKGPAYYNGSEYKKLDRTKPEEKLLSKDTKDEWVKDGWIAGLQHHFVTAIVPQTGRSYSYTIKVSGEQYLLSTSGRIQTVAPLDKATIKETIFVGPKLQNQLKIAGQELDLVADYGILTILARPLFWLLGFVHKAVQNWGWAIIIVTALLKLLFYPLSEASGKSTAKMRVLGPRLKLLQETHKDDREKLGRATMELYKREKVNPLAGCLPILIQMPVFFAFYWVLLESVEMRQAPFMGWLQDLSSKDPYYVLPLIMSVAMFIQTKLNPTPPDPLQAKLFMIMPLIMSVTFAFFPAGLVLYWVTNTVLSILQQWNINRRIESISKVSHG